LIALGMFSWKNSAKVLPVLVRRGKTRPARSPKRRFRFRVVSR
jgi:hypothetical protein